MRRIARLVVALLLAATSGCAHSSAAGSVDGGAVEKAIAGGIAPQISSSDSQLVVGASKCADRLHLSDGKVATCALYVNGVPVPVQVASSTAPPGFTVSLDGQFLEIDKVQARMESSLRSSGVMLKAVGCPDPAYQVLKPSAIVTCAVYGSSTVSSVRFKVLSQGIYMFNPTGVRAASAIPKGVVNGATVVAFIRHSMGVDPKAAGEVVTCPPTVDLTGNKRGTCSIRHSDGLTQRLDVSTDNATGVSVRPLDAIISRDKVSVGAATYYNQRLQSTGKAANATVDCGTGRISVPVHGTFDCKMSVAGKPYRLVVTVDDGTNGSVHWVALKRN